MPTRGRPHNLARFLDAYRATGATTSLMIRIDDDDPTIEEYGKVVAKADDISIRVISGPRIGPSACHNDCFAAAPDETFYGIVADDLIPRTDQWDVIMGRACRGGIVYANDGIHGSGLPTHPFICGDLVRKWGWISPPGMRHWFTDNAWGVLGSELECLRYMPSVLMEHMHPLAGKAQDDATYRGCTPEVQRSDHVAFEMWMARDLADVVKRCRA